jgi:hypothetical protein
MKKHEAGYSSSESDISYEEILDELMQEFDLKKLNKFTSEEQIKLT